jgi:hypothetical protein
MGTHDVKEDEYETFVVDRISRCIDELGLREGKYLLDEKTRFNVILKALNAGIQTIEEQRQEKGQCMKCGAEHGCEHRAMSLGTKEINDECDHDDQPPECSAINWEEMRLSLDLHPKPMEYYLNENIERWFWDRKENKET